MRRSGFTGVVFRAAARALACAGFALCAIDAGAHPHVRFSYIVEPLIESGRISALRVEWVMDPIASMMVLRSVDRNGDGAFSPDELAAFARGNQPLLASSRYFLTLTRAGRAVDFELPRELEARFVDRRVTLTFVVRVLDAQQDPRPAGLAAPLHVRFFDRTWYVALQAHEPAIAAMAPCSGRAQVAALATEGWGVQLVPELEIACPAPGVAAAPVVP